MIAYKSHVTNCCLMLPPFSLLKHDRTIDRNNYWQPLLQKWLKAYKHCHRQTKTVRSKHWCPSDGSKVVFRWNLIMQEHLISLKLSHKPRPPRDELFYFLWIFLWLLQCFACLQLCDYTWPRGTQLQSDEDAVLTKVCNVLPFDSASNLAWIFGD